MTALGRGRPLVLIALLVSPEGAAPQPLTDGYPVFEVILASCEKSPKKRRQTGFIARPWRGIVTSLHGVAGCESLFARMVEGEQTRSFPNLEVRSVDLERDLVLLWSPDLDEEISSGRLRSYPVSDSLSADLIVRGFPSVVTAAHTFPLVLESPDKRILDLVGSPLIERLADRRSPDINVRVLSVTGDLQPGHSGAPVLNRRGEVVGIGSGGISGSGIGWAVPSTDVTWLAGSDPRARREVQRLAGISASLVFQFDSEGIENHWGGGRIAVNGSAFLGGDGQGISLSVASRQVVARQRLDVGATVSYLRAGYRQVYSTLEGLAPISRQVYQDRGSAGILLRWLMLPIPKGWVDPFLGFELDPFRREILAEIGGDLSLSRTTVLQISLGQRYLRMDRELIEFQEFGQAEVSIEERALTPRTLRFGLALRW